MRRNERLLVESVDLNNYLEVSYNLAYKALSFAHLRAYICIEAGLKLIEGEWHDHNYDEQDDQK